MSRIYMYPKNDYETLESPNPYVPNVEESLAEKHIIINQKPNYKGVIELFLFFFKTDIFFFNWIEDVVIKKHGKIQAVLFPVFLFFAKVFGKKIIWVLHNKYSHEKSNRKWIRFGFNLMIRNSDLIITHSNDGIGFVTDKFPKHAKKVKYIVHPVEDLLVKSVGTEKKYDFLIWGTIHPYKGVIEFLEHAHRSSVLKDAKIAVSGICPHPELKEKLESLLNEKIVHLDGFFDIDEIASLAAQSKYVLFTYNSESVLSSGSLMDTIRMGSVVVGPDKGAFKDLKGYGFMKTYSAYEEIDVLFDQQTDDSDTNQKEVETFCRNNSWKLYGEKLFNVANGIL